MLALLKALGEHNLITQMPGQLVLGVEARTRRKPNTYRFQYSERIPPECEARVVALFNNKPLVVGQLIIFAGKRWGAGRAQLKVIALKSCWRQTSKFGGDGQSVRYRETEMRRVYIDKAMPIYLDKTAKETRLKA